MRNKVLFSYLLPLLIVAIAIALFVLMLVSKTMPKAEKAAVRTWAVAVITAAPKTYTPNLVLHGSVESPRHATLRAAVTADVIATPVDEGEHISKGQLFIQLDPSDAKLLLQQRTGEVNAQEAKIAAENTRYQADLKALDHEKKLLVLSQRALSRQLRLKEHTSKAAVDKAREDLNQQQLDLTARDLSVKDHQNRLAELQGQLLRLKALQDQAALDLKRTQIPAPFTGRVAKLTVAVGDRVRPGDELGQIFDLSALEIRALIPSQYLQMIRDALATKQQLTATAEVDGHPIKLKLDRLAATVGHGRSGIDALLQVITGENYLEVGRTVEVLLNLPPQHDAVALPTQALYGLDLIYIVKNQRLQGITVKRVGSFTKPDEKQQVFVKSPNLKAGDQVVITQLPNAINGLKVRVVPK